MEQVLFIFFSVVIGLTLYSLWSFGYFTRIHFQTCKTEPMVLVYEKFIGSTQKVVPVLDELCFNLLDKDSIDTFRNVGIYYDKPHVLTFRKCRTVVGCLLEKEDLKHLEQLKGRYNVIELPAQECYTASYPFCGPLSISVAVLRVYPKIKKVLQKKYQQEAPVLEVYDDEKGLINYYAGNALDLPPFDAL